MPKINVQMKSKISLKVGLQMLKDFKGKLRHRSLGKRTKIMIVTLCVTMLIGVPTNYVLQRYQIFGVTFANEIFISRIKMVGKVGKIVFVSTPKDLPKFKTSEEAIKYVKSFKYNSFISDPTTALLKKEGNCLGKSRLLYYIGKNQGFKVDFIKTKDHVNVIVAGKVYDLTQE